jgi:hypothetical protein
MNYAHAMHFNITSKKYVLDAKSRFMEILFFEGLHIIIIPKFKFQKMCTKVHNGSNIHNTSFELFDLENVQYQLE